ncbi:hypothetical protein CN198_14250 [Sinorhizobium meliloti]|uniref:hypothetical protein n=1 Tax=Rhizobium meliloti TaxID=382 RepID=UPI000FDB7BAB|nr:hypothetical protein [Sinorhizobium meliloti]RVH69217.1 hypothetical protein CN198_14250 [Sinorhizobium meliloti]
MTDASILCAKYPRLIPDPFGFAYNARWVELLDDFFAVVDRVLPAEAAFQLLQVKEKFGGLRIYYDIDGAVPDAVSNEIKEANLRAEARSEHICETCGKRGRMSNRGGYYTTICEEHAEVDGRLAIPAREPEGSVRVGSKEGGWRRYDFDKDAFVPCDPLEGW